MSHEEKSLRIKMLIVGLIVIGGFVVWLLANEYSFQTSVRGIARAGPLRIEVCDLRGVVVVGPCTPIGGPDGKDLQQVTDYLAHARAALPPGKSPILSEKIVRIASPESAQGQYVVCYRFLKFTGFDEAYFNEVSMDAHCQSILKYRSNYVSIQDFD